MSKMLDEMIQDRVESGQLVKGVRGSVRIASERKRETIPEAVPNMEPLKSPMVNEAPMMAAEV
jgi:centromeric protein E